LFHYQCLSYEAHYLSAVCSCCSLDGIEVRLINVLASKMNFTAVFAWPRDQYNWGFIWDNGTLAGMIGTPSRDWPRRLRICQWILRLSTYRGMGAIWGWARRGGGECITLKIIVLHRAGVFNLSDNAGHINNFNDGRGPLSYTECHRRNGPNFGRVFLMLNYTDITQNTYIQS